jgi:hypothetical protein
MGGRKPLDLQTTHRPHAELVDTALEVQAQKPIDASVLHRRRPVRMVDH